MFPKRIAYVFHVLNLAIRTPGSLLQKALQQIFDIPDETERLQRLAVWQKNKTNELKFVGVAVCLLLFCHADVPAASLASRD